jgi:NAD+ synthase (glutamine-hydrolysing)
MKIALAQMNPTIGALSANAHQAYACAQRAHKDGAQLIIFPELYLCGYPPKDLLLRPDFLSEVAFWALWLAKNTPLPLILGAPYGHAPCGLPYNAALWCWRDHVSIAAKKRLLPNYSIFDEKRYFATPDSPACDLINFENKRFLISICEDAWKSLPDIVPINYAYDPVALAMKEQNIDFFINISASPYTVFKPALREKLFKHLAKKYHIPVLVAGQVGANDQLLFDGHSLIIDALGTIKARAKPCTEDLLLFDSATIKEAPKIKPLKSGLELSRKALVMGIRDYVKKCGAQGLIIGLSGGIDSAVCAALCVEALGAAHVKVCYLPSKYSSTESHDDALLLAHNLELNLEIIPIESHVEDLRSALRDFFKSSHNHDISDQNIQARMRGLIVMALSNSSDHFMICTSNKSELAVGYGTLYGDLCGAFAPLGDLYKTEVWQLARLINNKKIIIPEAIINKPPTAELKYHQRDSDSLPDYTILDKILYNYIELNMSIEDIFNKTKINIDSINNIITLIARQEYKRRQSPLALMLSARVFGDSWRMPLAKALPSLSVTAMESHK